MTHHELIFSFFHYFLSSSFFHLIVTLVLRNFRRLNLSTSYFTSLPSVSRVTRPSLSSSLICFEVNDLSVSRTLESSLFCWFPNIIAVRIFIRLTRLCNSRLSVSWFNSSGVLVKIS